MHKNFSRQNFKICFEYEPLAVLIGNAIKQLMMIMVVIIIMGENKFGQYPQGCIVQHAP